MGELEHALAGRDGKEGALAELPRGVRELRSGALERLDEMGLGAGSLQCLGRALGPGPSFLDVEHRHIDLGEVSLVSLLVGHALRR